MRIGDRVTYMEQRFLPEKHTVLWPATVINVERLCIRFDTLGPQGQPIMYINCPSSVKQCVDKLPYW